MQAPPAPHLTSEQQVVDSDGCQRPRLADGGSRHRHTSGRRRLPQRDRHRAICRVDGRRHGLGRRPHRLAVVASATILTRTRWGPCVSQLHQERLRSRRAHRLRPARTRAARSSRAGVPTRPANKQEDRKQPGHYRRRSQDREHDRVSEHGEGPPASQGGHLDSVISTTTAGFVRRSAWL